MLCDCVVLMYFYFLACGKVLYVSKASGNNGLNGNNSCLNKTSPCKTLNYVIVKASSNDVIMVDSNNTERVPYDSCSSQTLHKNLNFKSWHERAVINCSGGELSFVGGLSLGEVSFCGLRFIDTFIRLTNASLAVTNCIFGSFQVKRNFSYIIDVFVSAKTLSTNINISVTNSSFMENNLTGCLSVVNCASAGVLVEIENSSIINNNLPNLMVRSLISVVGIVNFSFVNSEISNTTFSQELRQPSVSVFSILAGGSDLARAKNVDLPSSECLYHEEPSVLSLRFVGGNFYGNNAKIIKATSEKLAHVDIINTNFSMNTDIHTAGGVIFINSTESAQPVEVHFNNCWFISNQGVSLSTVLYFKLSDPLRSSISLESCHFHNNKDIPLDEFSGNGATVYIEAQNLSLYVMSCEFYLNQAAMTGGVYVKAYQCGHLHFKLTHIKSCYSWAEAPDSSGGITVIFGDSQNRRQRSELSEFRLSIEDCEFYNNTAALRGTGALVSSGINSYGVHSPSHSSGNVTIQRSHFEKNLASNGAGGICISSHFDCNITDTEFRDNAGFEAGAIYFTGGYLTLRNCTLRSNYGGTTASTLASGSLRLSENGTAVIRDSKIIQDNVTGSFGNYLDFHGGVGLFSSEFCSISLYNSSLEFLWRPSVEKIVVVEIARKNLTIDDATVIRCPVSYSIKNITVGSSVTGKFSVQCRLCRMGSYSEDRGVYSGFKKHTIKCLSCPYGGKCMQGLQALPNFWGYWSNETVAPRVKFSRCPLGYCCQAERHRKSCFPFNTCHNERQGRLCGECRSNFSETLFTPSCRKSENCNDFWVWPVAAIFVLGFSMYFIIQPDFVGMLWNWVTWYSRGNSQNNIENEKVFDPGYERVVFFYYQATDVLLVGGSFDVWDKYISQFVLGIFNFEIRLNREGFACPFPGLNPVSKIFLHTLGVYSVLFALPVIFLFHCLLYFCLGREQPKTGSYLSAFIKGILLGYAVLAGKSMKLVKCVTVDGVNCLFVNCNIHCYTWWQTLLLTSVFVYFLPFVLVLYFGAYKLFDKKISVFHFILACFFPLPFLSYWFITWRAFEGKYVPDSAGREAITSLLIGSYRTPDHVNRGAIYWESVLIGRMLVLILANELIKEPFLRSLTLLLICVINLCLHVHVFPFEFLTANRAETLSLFSLVLIAIFNVPFCGYLSEGVVPSGPISKIMEIFSWGQAFLVGFLPFVCILLLLFAVVSQTVRLVCFICKCCRCACCRICCCLRYRGENELASPLV